MLIFLVSHAKQFSKVDSSGLKEKGPISSVKFPFLVDTKQLSVVSSVKNTPPVMPLGHSTFFFGEGGGERALRIMFRRGPVSAAADMPILLTLKPATCLAYPLLSVSRKMAEIRNFWYKIRNFLVSAKNIASHTNKQKQKQNNKKINNQNKEA